MIAQWLKKENVKRTQIPWTKLREYLLPGTPRLVVPLVRSRRKGFKNLATRDRTQLDLMPEAGRDQLFLARTTGDRGI